MKHCRQPFIILYMMPVLSAYDISLVLAALKLCVPMGSSLMAILPDKFFNEQDVPLPLSRLHEDATAILPEQR